MTLNLTCSSLLGKKLGTRRVRTAVSQVILVALGLCCASVSSAFEELTPAQSLIYDTPHLSNTDSGQTITYSYAGDFAEGDKVSGKVTLSISNAQENGKRDVAVEFLSDERKLALPDFQGYRGNPVIIAMLEYIAREMGNESGGGALYFRNRIRDALASKSLEILDKKMASDGENISIKELRFLPFKDDEYLGNQPRYAESEFIISLSDEVPGGVVSIDVRSALKDELQFYHGLKISQI